MIGSHSEQLEACYTEYSIIITGLQPDTEYCYQGIIYDVDSDKRDIGDARSFTTLPSSSSNPFAAWKFDKGYGQEAADSSGNGHRGQLGSGTGTDNRDPSWVTGISGQALQFAGDDYVYVPYGNDAGLGLDTEQLTIDVWVKCTDVNHNQTIVSSKTGDTSEGTLWVFRNSNDGLRFKYNNGSWSSAYFTDWDFFDGYDGAWVHIVITADYNTGELKFYRNNTLDYENDMGTSAIGPNKSELWIGRYNNWLYGFEGIIDEVKIYESIVQP